MKIIEINCEIVSIQAAGTYLLVSDRRPISPEDRYNMGRLGVKKIEAITGGMINIPSLPEHIEEAYKRGVRSFKLKVQEIISQDAIYTPQGLLDVTYDEPKKQTFTREEVLRIMTHPDSRLVHPSEAENWIDKYYK